MTDPRKARKDMLVGLVDLHAANDQLSFGKAREIADRMANEALLDPMLLAWFDRKNWTHSPSIC